MMRAINAVLKFTELSEDSIIDAGGASLDRGSNAWAAPDIQDRKITIVEFKDRMFRIHAIHQSPIHFGTSGHHRFDSPDGSYGVVYAGRDEYLCIH